MQATGAKAASSRVFETKSHGQIQSRARQGAGPRAHARGSGVLFREACGPRVASGQRGITLIELLVAMAIIGLMLAITFPSFTAGLDGIVLRTDIDRAGSFFNQARLQADRLQQPVQLTADPGGRKLSAVSVDGLWEESFVLNDRSHIVFPKQKQSLILHPSTPAPQFRLLLQSERGARAGLQINIFTGVPEDWNPDGGDVK